MLNLVTLLTTVIFVVWANGSAAEQSMGGVSPPQHADELAKRSRKAIIETGFSEGYFDEHFRLVETFDRLGDVRVVWRFSINGYEMLVSDAIGYYTEGQKRIYVHSVKNTLGATRDISRTITRRRAETLMRACLGKYTGEATLLMRLSRTERASLYLTAQSITRPGQRDKGLREIESEERVSKRQSKIDEPEREVIKPGPPMYLGYINLETGRCSRGQARVTP
jgi:hypothetical protein